MQAERYADDIDKLEAASPGMKAAILSGEVESTVKDVQGMAKQPKRDIKRAGTKARKTGKLPKAEPKQKGGLQPKPISKVGSQKDANAAFGVFVRSLDAWHATVSAAPPLPDKSHRAALGIVDTLCGMLGFGENRQKARHGEDW